MKKFLVALAVTSAITAPAHAETAILGFTGGTTFDFFADNETVGWSFVANSDLTVTDLGWFSPSGNDLNSSHTVGIWNLAGLLLGSATIDPGAVDGTGYRYVSSSPFILSSGQQYVIGGNISDSDDDQYVTFADSVDTDPLISFAGTAVSPIGSGFAFANDINANGVGRFGANFQFLPGAVPEPATWAFMIFGFGAIGGAMRRQRKANVKVSYA
ncbi:MAG: PEPxxWA-CTERM sorting domain-containing protein [Pseudomonadota bacterium]